MSVADAEDVGRVRLYLELECLRDSVENGDEDWEGQLVAAYHKLSRAEAMPKADPQRGIKVEQRNAEFHEALVSACTSPLMLKLRAQMFACHERYRNLSRSLGPTGRDTPAEHKAIFDAAIKRDAPKLLELSRTHITRTTETVTRYLNETDAKPERTFRSKT